MTREKVHGKPWTPDRLKSAFVVGWPALVLASALASAGVAGESPSPGVSLPGLEADPPGSVTVRSAAVTLRDDHVTLDLALSATSETAELLLNGPQFGFLGASERYPDRHFPELSIRLNGVVIAPQDRFEATVGRNTVTSLLRAADMDPWTITRNPPVTTANPHNPQVLHLLRNAGAIADAGRAADGGALYTAKWVARRLLAIPLAPAVDATVQLEYDARPGIAVPTGDPRVTALFERLYCVSEKEIQRLQPSSRGTPVSFATYDIATGIDGQSPVTVALSWRALSSADPTPSNMIFWCGPRGKPLAGRGSVERARAATDAAGILHVLMFRR